MAVQSALQSLQALESHLEKIRNEPGPVHQALFQLTDKWHDYMAVSPAFASRLAADDQDAPTWRETSEWARWMLTTRFLDASGTHSEMSGDQVEQHLKLAQQHAWAAFFPSMSKMPQAHWRVYWSRIARTFGSAFTENGRKSLSEVAASDARTVMIQNRKMSSARQQEAASEATTVVASMLNRSEKRGGLLASCLSPVKADAAEMKRMGLTDYRSPPNDTGEVVSAPTSPNDKGGAVSAPTTIVPSTKKPQVQHDSKKIVVATGRWKRAAAHVTAAEERLAAWNVSAVSTHMISTHASSAEASHSKKRRCG